MIPKDLVPLEVPDPSRSSKSLPKRPWPLAHYASIAHVARVYDYLLGGKDNFAADREAAEQAMLTNPSVVPSARANRAFLARAIRYLTGEAGLRQFLDIGTGMPASRNIHEVAQSVAPQARVVYADHDRSCCAVLARC
jgi:S-adenosyl methyltransferase